jgi:acyl carrier protein
MPSRRPQARHGGSVLQRLVALLGETDIIVTPNTKWTDLGFDGDSLDVFVRGNVSEEFGVPLSGEDAGKTVGDLVKAINRALGA